MDRMARVCWRALRGAGFLVPLAGFALFVGLAGASLAAGQAQGAGAEAGAGAETRAAPAPESVTPDMVVTVEKLRRVRVLYTRFGRYMRGCQITQSSGSAAVDGFVCVLLRQCILQGNLEPPAAKRCLDARIASVRSGRDEGEEEGAPVVIATPLADMSPPLSPPLPTPPLPALDTSLRARKDRPAVASAVVAGLWHVRHGPILRDHPRPGDTPTTGMEWTVCMAETEPGRALARLLDAPTQDIGRACSGFAAAPRGGRFTASRSCLFRGRLTVSYDVSGTLESGRLHTSVRLTGDPMQQLESRGAPYGARYSLDAERVGDCPAPAAPGK